jgi:hypothetical protein
MRNLFDEWTAATHDIDDLKFSLIIIELYNTDKAFAQPLADSAVGPALRSKRIHAFCGAMYFDPARHAATQALGMKFREILNGDDTNNDKPLM